MILCLATGAHLAHALIGSDGALVDLGSTPLSGAPDKALAACLHRLESVWVRCAQLRGAPLLALYSPPDTQVEVGLEAWLLTRPVRRRSVHAGPVDELDGVRPRNEEEAEALGLAAWARTYTIQPHFQEV